MAQAFHRLEHGPHPPFWQRDERFFKAPTLQEALAIHGGSEPRRLGLVATHVLRQVSTLAQNRTAFRQHLLLPSRQP